MQRAKTFFDRHVIGLIAAVTIFVSSSVLSAQDAPTAESAPAAVSEPENKPVDPAEELARKRKLRIAIVTGGLIAVTGMAMVALTILGGSATRRGLRRKPLTDAPLPPEPIPAERFDEVEGEKPARAPAQPRESAGGDGS